jgi:hypothetical protein
MLIRHIFSGPSSAPTFSQVLAFSSLFLLQSCDGGCKNENGNKLCDADEKELSPNTPNSPQPVTFTNMGSGGLFVHFRAPSATHDNSACSSKPERRSYQLIPGSSVQADSYGSVVCWCYGPFELDDCGAVWRKAFPNAIVVVPRAD